MLFRKNSVDLLLKLLIMRKIIGTFLLKLLGWKVELEGDLEN